MSGSGKQKKKKKKNTEIRYFPLLSLILPPWHSIYSTTYSSPPPPSSSLRRSAISSTNFRISGPHGRQRVRQHRERRKRLNESETKRECLKYARNQKVHVKCISTLNGVTEKGQRATNERTNRRRRARAANKKMSTHKS